MPATAVGSAKGSAISPSSILLHVKSYLTNVHASIVPNIQLITAAIKEQLILVINAFTTFFLVTSAINSPGESFNE